MMYVRDTSKEAYRQIQESGLLSVRRWEVYAALYRHGPCTGMELLHKNQSLMGSVDSQIRARLNELRELGVVRELGTTVCSVTGMNVILWDVTSSLPSRGKKREIRPSRRRLEAQIKEYQGLFERVSNYLIARGLTGIAQKMKARLTEIEEIK